MKLAEERKMIIPSLEQRPVIQKLSDIPQGGSTKAGFLVDKNAGWRNRTPVIDTEKCVSCYQCYFYCPDGVIRRTDEGPKIDYDFCKGCGICSKICRLGAVTMEEEK